MDISYAPSPTHKKAYIADIGSILVAVYGKKKYYTPQEVSAAHNKSKWRHGPDFSCWAIAVFSSRANFDAYHKLNWEVRDYASMKAEMLIGISEIAAADGPEIADLDLEVSWLDFGEVFESVLQGIGEFVLTIFTDA